MTMMKRNGERMQPCRTLRQNQRTLCTHLQSWHSSWRCHTVPWRC